MTGTVFQWRSSKLAWAAAVVSARVGVVPELVEGAGLLVSPGCWQEPAEAMESLRDERSRDTLAQRGRERVRQEFMVGRAARRLARL